MTLTPEDVDNVEAGLDVAQSGIRDAYDVLYKVFAAAREADRESDDFKSIRKLFSEYEDVTGDMYEQFRQIREATRKLASGEQTP